MILVTLSMFVAQGIVSSLVSTLFDISHGYHGAVISNIARLHMSDAVDESNDKHLTPWSEACLADGITNTPLSPYIDKVITNTWLHGLASRPLYLVTWSY